MKKIVAVILIIISLFSLACCSGIVSDTENEFYKKWMSLIDDQTFLKKIAIPGSHDAGTVGMIRLGKTQDTDILTQLNCGVRYFDIRVKQNKDGSLVIFHSILTGQKFEKVLQDIEAFSSTNTTEVIILDFEHFQGDSMTAVANLLEERLGDKLIRNEGKESDIDFVDQLKLSETRGKILVTWGSDTECERNYLFRRNNDEGTLDNCALDSYYYGSIHKKVSAYFIETALSQYFEKYIAKNKGLFVLQGQLTSPLFVPVPAVLEKSHDQNMTSYTEGLTYNASLLPYVNIIMRDFVNTSNNRIDYSKINSILKLNIAKKIVTVNFSNELK